MIKKTILYLLIFLSSFQLTAQDFENLNFGTDSTLDIISWNIEWFPKNGQTTITNVKNIIKALDVEVIAVQEIDSKSSFQQLLNDLEDYSGYYLNGDYQSLAYIYKTSDIQVEGNYEIFTNDSRQFPRAPLVLEITFRAQKYTIINNHLKCCGDGSLNPYDDWDEETRRLDACNMLGEYIEQYLENERVIVVGDMNDVLTDRAVDNVFSTFINNESHYLFTDMVIAEGSSSGWSYPNWPSHLDHIVITNELFETYNHNASSCEIIKLEEHFYGGYDEYDSKVSDHRPVGLKLYAPAQTGINDQASTLMFRNYPNPFTWSTVFSFPSSQNSRIDIYDSKGHKIDSINIPKGQTSVQWNAQLNVAGVYHAKLMEGDKEKAASTLVLVK